FDGGGGGAPSGGGTPRVFRAGQTGAAYVGAARRNSSRVLLSGRPPACEGRTGPSAPVARHATGSVKSYVSGAPHRLPASTAPAERAPRPDEPRSGRARTAGAVG